MDIHVRATASGPFLYLGDAAIPCVAGRGGIGLKQKEGDGITPIGRWPVRRLWYRADKLSLPPVAIPVRAIAPEDGWCDAPEDPHYNRPVRLPYPASHEEMWRADDLYDLVLELGYNDAPVVPGRGSAIFMHLVRPDREPTAGCIAVTPADMLRVLSMLTPASHVIVAG